MQPPTEQHGYALTLNFQLVSVLLLFNCGVLDFPVEHFVMFCKLPLMNKFHTVSLIHADFLYIWWSAYTSCQKFYDKVHILDRKLHYGTGPALSICLHIVCTTDWKHSFDLILICVTVCKSIQRYKVVHHFYWLLAATASVLSALVKHCLTKEPTRRTLSRAHPSPMPKFQCSGTTLQ